MEERQSPTFLFKGNVRLKEIGRRCFAGVAKFMQRRQRRITEERQRQPFEGGDRP